MRLANCPLSFWASCPFCNRKPPLLLLLLLVGADAEVEGEAAEVVMATEEVAAPSSPSSHESSVAEGSEAEAETVAEAEEVPDATPLAVLLPAPVPVEPTPGFCVMSTSC